MLKNFVLQFHTERLSLYFVVTKQSTYPFPFKCIIYT